MKVLKKHKYVKQHDLKDCGVACLATVAKHYGLTVSLSKLRELSGTDKEGTTVYGLIKAAKSLKLKNKVVKTKDYNDIFGDFPKPAIAHVNKNGIMHYVVIYEVNENEILAADPAIGIVKYRIKEFFLMWSGVMILLYPSEEFEKGDKSISLIKKFGKIIVSQKKMVISTFIISILAVLLGIVGSFYYKILLDRIFPNNLKDSLTRISIAVIFVIALKNILEFIKSMLSIYISQNIDKNILLEYYKHVIDLPLEFFETREIGEVISRFSDGSNIREALSSATLTILIDSTMMIVGGILLFRENQILFYFSFIPIFFYIIIVYFFKNQLEETNKRIMQSGAKLTSHLIQSLHGIETIKTLTGEKHVNEETELRFSKFLKEMLFGGFINNLQVSLKSLIQGVFGIFVLWAGGVLVLSGKMSIGSLITFNGLLIYFIGPIERIINLQSKIQTGFVAGERLVEILELDKEKSKSKYNKYMCKEIFDNISFNNVSFRYGARKLVLKEIDLNINFGERIAFVGESGSGKTTLIKLLMNFYKCENGKILFGEKDINELNKRNLRENIAYVSQETFFFTGTIKENMLFANPKISEDEIIDICKKCKIHDYIDELPLKYDTMIEENASNLSGGQKQRLAIARAIIRNPRVLVLDEATSNLDLITEKAIENTIEEFSNKITTIIIAHRLSSVVKCDKIYVMREGQIVEYGTHLELIEKKEYYWQLWSRQTANII